MSTSLCRLLSRQSAFEVSRILTRRPDSNFAKDKWQALRTRSIAELIDTSDVIVECSGDAVRAADVIEQAFQAGLPVVTMNAEFQVIAGTYYREHGLLSESEGDQPGCLAALNIKARQMGFEPVVFGSQKSFLNLNPGRGSMQHWAKRQGLSLTQTTSFTDGTKIQIESALVANGLGASLLIPGLLGPTNTITRDGASELAYRNRRRSKPIVDYVLKAEGKGEVFVVATHTDDQSAALGYYKMGPGPYYYLEQPHHLGHLEIPGSVQRLLQTRRPLLNNGPQPTVSVAAVAKRDIAAGTFVERGIGGFDLRGTTVAIKDEREHVPIGLLNGCEIQRSIRAGEMITSRDVALPETLASRAWEFTRDRVLAGPRIGTAANANIPPSAHTRRQPRPI